MNRRIEGIVDEISAGAAGVRYDTASTGERLLAAMVARRTDLLEREGYTAEEAMNRLSAEEQEWVRARGA